VVLVFSVIVFVIVLLYQYEIACFKRKATPEEIAAKLKALKFQDDLKNKKFKTFSNKISMFDEAKIQESGKESVKPKMIMVKKRTPDYVDSQQDQGTERHLIQSKVTGYGQNPVIEIDNMMDQLSEDSDEEEQTPMIVAEDERESFTAKLPGEDLLEEKEIDDDTEKESNPPQQLNVEKSPVEVSQAIDFVYSQEVKKYKDYKEQEGALKKALTKMEDNVDEKEKEIDQMDEVESEGNLTEEEE